MRNYWLKIALGTLGVFVLGMLLITLVRKGRNTVHDVVEGSGPLSIPLPPMVPFNLDDTRLGSIRHLTVYRSSPKVPSRFAVAVQLADSTSAARLASCILYIKSLDNVDEHTSFRCGAVTDTAGLDLVPFGAVTLRGTTDSFPLLLPRSAVQDLRGTRDHVADSMNAMGDHLADSIMQAVSGAVDSTVGAQSDVRERGQVMADSIRDLWRARADSIRAAAQAAQH